MSNRRTWNAITAENERRFVYAGYPPILHGNRSRSPEVQEKLILNAAAKMVAKKARRAARNRSSNG